MSVAPNPILRSGSSTVRFSEHARFRMEERGVDSDHLVETLLKSTLADFEVDARTGNFVFRIGKYRVVAKKIGEDGFMISSVFTEDQLPI